MTTVLCTLFNSLYLDKGLVLYDSLCECAKDFKLYVLCMDDKCYDVLTDFRVERLIPIHLYEVENEKMLEAKNNRSIAEYCWTCSSRLIQYILETYKHECCTYIDADMYFYHDPQVLIEEMLAAGKSVMMVPHRFTERNKIMAEKVGTYCVEFNCFKNNDAGLEVLSHWHNRCLECCSNLGDGIHWGDQKYMDEWEELYPKAVKVCTHPGAGVAPWNLGWYQRYNKDNNLVEYKKDEKLYELIFFHFQSVQYINNSIVNTDIEAHLPEVSYTMVDELYKPYLDKIQKRKELIKEKYGIDLLIKIHPSKTDMFSKIKLWLRGFGLVRILSRMIHGNYQSYMIDI